MTSPPPSVKDFATKLSLSVGDTLLLLGQGYHAASAYGKYPIAAIVDMGSPELSKSLVYLPLNEMQRYLSMGGWSPAAR